ncbi:class I SAM-dependent methyltransferase [Promicromonospora sp. NPDC019610]|uniref:class I SAM-dependent methyltransferase n=1 Tax=Promicromonospora sp. NPDC019610 TaxID=3364405 RepID=UPI003787E3C5
MKPDHYDEFAASYDTENSGSLLNAWYERPAMVRLAGDVRGRKILDAGCGSGPLSAELRDRGADMTGFDGSPSMVELARRRLGDDVPLTVADLAQPLPYADDTFDDVVSSLVLHYLEDWRPPLTELHRVLKPGGRLILSVNHPLVRPFNYPKEDYFAVQQYSEEYDFAGQPGTLTYWHRPLHAMVDAFTAAGFGVASVAEPPPSPDTPTELLPPRIATGERTAFVSFLFFVLEAR